MKQWLQEILSYIVLASALEHLVSHEKYLPYFQFVTGLVMILLLASPVLSLMGQDKNWYQSLENKIWQSNQNDIQEEMKVADQDFQSVLHREYEKEIEKEIVQTVNEQGMQVGDVQAQVGQKQDKIYLKNLSVYIGEKKSMENTPPDTKSTVSAIKAITPVQADEDDQAVNHAVSQKQDRQTARLQNVLCKKYELTKKEVSVWRTEQ